MKKCNQWNRRQFAGTAVGAVASLGLGHAAGKGVSIVIDPRDEVAAAPPARWAAKEPEQSLTAHGVTVSMCDSIAAAKAGDLCVLSAAASSSIAAGILKQARLTVANAPQALAICPGAVSGKNVLMACGHDVRGLVYALLDLS